MKLYYCFMIFSICYFTSFSESKAQDTETSSEFYKNSLQGTLGFAGLYAAATSNYERILSFPKGKFVTATYLRAGLGAYGVWGGNGNYFYAQYGIFTGKKASHFEISAGPNFGFNENSSEVPVIAASAGYRLQRPGKHFMLRTGLGFPESLYFGLGWSF
ncbi:hypothetical protein AAGF08_13160 [Algoriphagus sp. SE2]|uniref:hypothetical protein n=1 Tax=Algoriphagus sp. SE2 TaxID=3141536 RepID=UPI0031CD2085